MLDYEVWCDKNQRDVTPERRKMVRMSYNETHTDSNSTPNMYTHMYKVIHTGTLPPSNKRKGKPSKFMLPSLSNLPLVTNGALLFD